MSGPAAAFDLPAGTLMKGKRGLVMGVANKRSIAWAIAQAAANAGARLAFTYQGEKLGEKVAELAKTRPVVVLARSAAGAEALLAEDAPPVAFVPTVRDLERYLATQDIRVVLYVNQNTRNFQMFRYGRRWHVFINHGESDKMYMTTNQYKAYDYAMVAGQAARDRLSRVLWDYDVDARTIEIGRPQADHYSGALPYTPDDRTVVLRLTTGPSARTARRSSPPCSRRAAIG